MNTREDSDMPESDLDDEQITVQEFQRRNELNEDNQNDLRRGALAMNQFWVRGLHLLYAYEGNKTMAFDCFMVAIGEGPNIGLEGAVSISKKYCGDDSQKATANKCIQYFQERLGIPAMPGQRSDEGRREMAEARNGQLAKV